MLSTVLWNGLKGLLRGLGETDSWKNSKISWHCPCESIAEVRSICQLLLLFKYWRGMSDPGLLASGSIFVTPVMANEWEEFSSDQWWDLATVLGSIPASSDRAESKGPQMKQCWIKYMKRKRRIFLIFIHGTSSQFIALLPRPKKTREAYITCLICASHLRIDFI